MTIGEMIRNKRKEKNLTQQELGKLLDVSSQMIAQYENDRRKPKIDTLRKICIAMNMSISELGEDIWKYYSAKDFQGDFAKFGKNIKITFSTKMPDSVEEKKRNDLIEIFNGLSSHGKDEAPHLLNAFSSLNSTGQSEAVKRIRELSKIEGYRKDDPEYDPEYQKAIASAPGSKIIVLPYFRAGVSAGSGIFILGNEAEDEIELPDLPEYEAADFAIDVSGDSMEPDFLDSDIALVQQDAELFPGDIGVFVVNSNAFIKELGKNELISRNKDYKNIPIHDGDNVVCMGKVIGKVKTDEE